MSDAMIVDNPRAVAGGNNPPPLREILAEKHAEIAVSIDGLADRANSAPKEIATDADLGRVGDIVKDARALNKRIDKVRDDEGRPHLEAKREIDAFFKGHMERLDRVAATLQKRADQYQAAKAAEARRVAEDKARREREEADRQRRIAEEEAARNRPTAALKHADKAEVAEERAAEAEAAAAASNADLTRVRSETGTVASARTGWDFEITDYAAVPLEALRPYLARAEVEKAIRQHVRINKNAVPLAGVRVFESVKAAFR